MMGVIMKTNVTRTHIKALALFAVAGLFSNAQELKGNYDNVTSSLYDQLNSVAKSVELTSNTNTSWEAKYNFVKNSLNKISKNLLQQQSQQLENYVSKLQSIYLYILSQQEELFKNQSHPNTKASLNFLRTFTIKVLLEKGLGTQNDLETASAFYKNKLNDEQLSKADNGQSLSEAVQDTLKSDENKIRTIKCLITNDQFIDAINAIQNKEQPLSERQKGMSFCALRERFSDIVQTAKDEKSTKQFSKTHKSITTMQQFLTLVNIMPAEDEKEQALSQSNLYETIEDLGNVILERNANADSSTTPEPKAKPQEILGLVEKATKPGIFGHQHDPQQNANKKAITVSQEIDNLYKAIQLDNDTNSIHQNIKAKKQSLESALKTYDTFCNKNSVKKDDGLHLKAEIALMDARGALLNTLSL